MFCNQIHNPIQIRDNKLIDRVYNVSNFVFTLICNQKSVSDDINTMIRTVLNETKPVAKCDMIKTIPDEPKNNEVSITYLVWFCIIV